MVVLDNRQELYDYIKEYKFVVVKVSATWCGPCKKIASYVDSIIKELPNAVKIVYVDFDKQRDIANAMKVKAVPTFMFYLHGSPDVCYVGSSKKNVLSFFQNVQSKVIH